MRHRVLLFLTATVFTANALAQFETRQNSANGVMVAVTPGDLSAGAKTWDFTVILNTHSQDLADDLAKSAVLLDDKGTAYKALGWEGAGPGGHHRKGVLKFNAIMPRPRAVELRLSRPGEANPRTFRWELK